MPIAAILGSALALLSLTGGGAGSSLPEWMAGSWAGVQDGVEMEEHWTAARGGSMLGLHRDVAKGRTASFEFLRIELAKEGAVYWASPGGAPATPFQMIESGPRRVVFENREHDYPTRILYWIAADGALHARIEGTLHGKAESSEWTWRQAP